jgi:hypothetical protein
MVRPVAGPSSSALTVMVMVSLSVSEVAAQ